MIKVRIEPKNSRQEILVLSVVTLIIFAVYLSWFLVKLYGGSEVSSKLKPYQISLDFFSVSGRFISEKLDSAGMFINSYHMKNSEIWPTISELDRFGVEPFVQDSAWNANGRMVWMAQDNSVGNMAHSIVFMGRPSVATTVNGRFLLVLKHFHSINGSYYTENGKTKPYEIWFTKKSGYKIPVSVTRPALVSQGWKEVVFDRQGKN